MSLKLNTASGGSITLQEADTASNLTLTVPATAGTMLTTASAGTVLQVVSDFRAVTRLATSSTSFVNTDITDTITPSSASSKILILISTSANNEASGRNIYFNLSRNGTSLSGTTEGMGAYLNALNSRAEVPLTISHLDSPNSTSPVTYTLQARSGGGSAIEVPHSTTIKSSIILMEIAG
jgi:hypothetical protein